MGSVGRDWLNEKGRIRLDILKLLKKRIWPKMREHEVNWAF